jgi:DNA-binding IclR family transcriptional regulator
MRSRTVTKERSAPSGEAPDDRVPESGRGGGIQSIERAFAILEQVARAPDGVGLADLGKRVGLHNSTAFHLLKTMVSLGYVLQDKESKRYRIGRQLFTLAAGALNEIELVTLATPVLESLSQATGECSHFAIRSGDDVVVLARTAGSGLFQMTDKVGVVRPAHCTALGKVLMAHLQPSRLDRYLGASELRRFTAKTIVEREALIRELDEVRRTGIGFDDGEFDAEGRCVAVAVRDFTGQVAGAIGISGPIWRLSLPAIQAKAEQVREAADALSRELGFDADHEGEKPVSPKR